MKDILKGLIIAGLFTVPFLTLVVADTYFFPYITGKNFAFRIIVEIVVGLWVILALLDKTYRPRFSWLLASFGALLVVMLAATLGAKHIPTALWSNFERMDGYVTLVHVFGYFVVLGTVLRTKTLWTYFLHTTLAVASLVAMKGLAQLSGNPRGGVNALQRDGLAGLLERHVHEQRAGGAVRRGLLDGTPVVLVNPVEAVAQGDGGSVKSEGDSHIN